MIILQKDSFIRANPIFIDSPNTVLAIDDTSYISASGTSMLTTGSDANKPPKTGATRSGSGGYCGEENVGDGRIYSSAFED
jgi:hypothetical protein